MEGGKVTMAGQSSVMIGWSWTDVSVLGSQVFGQVLMDSCGMDTSTVGYDKVSHFTTEIPSSSAANRNGQSKFYKT